MQLARWQADALRTLAPDHDLVICNCLNGHGSRRRAKHALYYLLNLWAIRNSQTRRVAFPSDLRPIAAHRDIGYRSQMSESLTGLGRSASVHGLLEFLIRLPWW